MESKKKRGGEHTRPRKMKNIILKISKNSIQLLSNQIFDGVNYGMGGNDQPSL